MYRPRRKKLSLLPAVALAALSALIAIPALSQARLYAAVQERFVAVTVQRGDNLWSIADRYTPSGQSVQDTVDHILAANRLSTSNLRPGQRVEIPQ